MPKEMMHWRVARKTSELLRDTEFESAMECHPEALLLGAIFHDSMFYLTGHWPDGVKGLAKTLHGSKGENTFSLLKAQAGLIRSRPDDPLPRAMFAGMVSHLFADCVFHPMVFHLTGAPDHNTDWEERHRLFETIMDTVLFEDKVILDAHELSALIAEETDWLDRGCPVDGLAHMAGTDPATMRSALEKAMNVFSRMQSLFLRPRLSRTLGMLRPILPKSIREIAALFYDPALTRKSAPVCGNISFIDPVTGKSHLKSLEEMADEAATLAANFCSRAEPSFATGDIKLFEEHGPCLDTGIPKREIKFAKHFASPLLP